MILKIETHGNGWRFIDSIATLHTDVMNTEKYKKEYGGMGRTYDGVFLTLYAQKDGELICETENCLPVKEIIAYFKDGHSENYLTDRTVYLMSDEGKTIERIN